MSYDPDEPWVDPSELAAANRRHDIDLAAIGISPYGRVNSAWSAVRLTLKGLLTDKKIAQYEEAGFYSLEFKEARRKRMEKMALRKNLNGAGETFRKGNFVERDGRLIYSPS